MTPKPPGADSTRVLLVDGRRTSRAALATVLGTQPDMTVVAAVATAAAALEYLTRDPSDDPVGRPDVAVVDQHLPDGTSPALCRRIQALEPSTRCIIHANTHIQLDPSTDVVVVPKQLDLDGLLAAIRHDL